MNLVGQIEEILSHEGLKQKTRNAALKETIEHYRQYLQTSIDYARSSYVQGRCDEYYLKRVEAERSLLREVLQGKTTYLQEVSKLTKDPYENEKRRKKEPGYFELENTVTSLFSVFYSEMEHKAKLLDETIRKLYKG
jgi:hypothetical protein